MNEYERLKKIGYCPKCGSKEFIVRSKVTGTISNFKSFDGKECENGEMYECLDYTANKWCICAGCGKRLFKIEDYCNSNNL